MPSGISIRLWYNITRGKVIPSGIRYEILFWLKTLEISRKVDGIGRN